MILDVDISRVVGVRNLTRYEASYLDAIYDADFEDPTAWVQFATQPSVQAVDAAGIIVNNGQVNYTTPVPVPVYTQGPARSIIAAYLVDASKLGRGVYYFIFNGPINASDSAPGRNLDSVWQVNVG